MWACSAAAQFSSAARRARDISYPMGYWCDRSHIGEARMRLQCAAGVDVQALPVDGYLHDLQPRRPQDVLHRLVAGRLDPAAISRIGKHLRRQFHGLLRARGHDHLIGRCPGAAHRRGVRGDRFAQFGQPVARAVFPVGGAGSRRFTVQKPLPDLARKKFAGRKRRGERRRRNRLVVTGVALQRRRALRNARPRGAALGNSTWRRRRGRGVLADGC